MTLKGYKRRLITYMCTEIFVAWIESCTTMKFTVILFAALAVASAVESEALAENEGLVPKDDSNLLQKLTKWISFQLPILAPIRTTPKPAPIATTRKPAPPPARPPAPAPAPARPPAPAPAPAKQPQAPAQAPVPAAPAPAPVPAAPAQAPVPAAPAQAPVPAAPAPAPVPAAPAQAPVPAAPAQAPSAMPAPDPSAVPAPDMSALMQELLNPPPELNAFLSLTLDNIPEPMKSMLGALAQHVLSKPPGSLNLDDPITIPGAAPA